MHFEVVKLCFQTNADILHYWKDTNFTFHVFFRMKYCHVLLILFQFSSFQILKLKAAVGSPASPSITYSIFSTKMPTSSCISSPCLNGGTCTLSTTGTPICQCPSCYSGLSCQTGKINFVFLKINGNILFYFIKKNTLIHALWILVIMAHFVHWIVLPAVIFVFVLMVILELTVKHQVNYNFCRFFYWENYKHAVKKVRDSLHCGRYYLWVNNFRSFFCFQWILLIIITFLKLTFMFF